MGERNIFQRPQEREEYYLALTMVFLFFPFDDSFYEQVLDGFSKFPALLSPYPSGGISNKLVTDRKIS